MRILLRMRWFNATVRARRDRRFAAECCARAMSATVSPLPLQRARAPYVHACVLKYHGCGPPLPLPAAALSARASRGHALPSGTRRSVAPGLRQDTAHGEAVPHLRRDRAGHAEVFGAGQPVEAAARFEARVRLRVHSLKRFAYLVQARAGVPRGASEPSAQNATQHVAIQRDATSGRAEPLSASARVPAQAVRVRCMAHGAWCTPYGESSSTVARSAVSSQRLRTGLCTM